MNTKTIPMKLLNIFSFIFITFTGISFLLILTLSSLFTKATAKSMVHYFPIYSDHATSSVSSYLYHELQLTNADAVSYFDISVSDIDTFLKETDFESTMSDIIYTYMKDVIDGTDNGKEAPVVIASFLQEHSSEFSRITDGVTIPDEFYDEIIKSAKESTDQFSLSTLMGSTEQTVLNTIKNLLSPVTMILQIGILLICGFLIWFSNRLHYTTALLQYGILFIIYGIFSFVILKGIKYFLDAVSKGSSTYDSLLINKFMANGTEILNVSFIVCIIVGAMLFAIAKLLSLRIDKKNNIS